MKNLLVLLSLLLLVAGLVVFLRGDEGGAGEGAARAGATAGPDESAAARPELVAPETAGPDVVDSGTPAERAALDSVPPQFANEAAEERPDARATGVVVDTAGNPVADARVLATGQGLVPLDVLEAPDWMNRVETRTDAAGRFELRGIAPASLRIAVRAPGFAPLNEENMGLPDEDELELEPFVLEASALLTGRVVDAEGVAVSGADLIAAPAGRASFFGGFRREPVATTDALGNFRVDQLAAGPWNLRVEHASHPSKRFTGVAPDAGVEVGSLEFRLDRSTNVRGRVVGLPAGLGARVEARPVGEQSWTSEPRHGAVGAVGDFTIGGLEQGKAYALRLQADQSRGDWFGRSSYSAKVEARGGDSGVVLEYLATASLAMRFVDARSGAPIEELSIEVGVDWPRPVFGEDGKRRRTFADGRYVAEELRLVDEDDVVHLQVRSKGYEPYELDDLRIEPGEAHDLGDVRLEPVPVYAVRVLDEGTRAPIPEAWVRASEDESDESSDGTFSRNVSFSFGGSDDDDHPGHFGSENRSAGRADEEGVATMNALGVERVRFEVTADGYARATLDGVEENPEGTTEATVLLSRGGSVLVQVVEQDGAPASGRTVEHRRPQEGGGQELMILGPSMQGGERTDSKGEVLFENLELGVHRFRVGKPGGAAAGFFGGDMVMISAIGEEPADDEWTSVEVVEGETVETTLVAPPTSDLVGRVTEAGSPLVGASLSLRKQEDGASSQAVLLSGMGFGGGPRGRSGSGGAYSIEDVEAGAYVLTVGHATRRMPMEFEVEVREGETVFDVDLPVSILEGRVVDQAGDPVAGATVRARQPRPEGGPRRSRQMVFVTDAGASASVGGGDVGGASVRTDADGNYRLRGVLHDVALEVSVDGDEFQPATSDVVQVGPGETRTGIDVEVAPGGKLGVDVFLADGTPAGMCLLTARPEDIEGAQPRSEVVEGGRVDLTGLEPGTWELSIRRFGPSSGEEAAPEPQRVEVAAGENDAVRFDLP